MNRIDEEILNEYSNLNPEELEKILFLLINHLNLRVVVEKIYKHDPEGEDRFVIEEC